MRRKSVFTAVLAATALAACSESPTAFRERDDALISANRQAVKFWETLASVSWNARAGELLALRVQDNSRVYAYMHFAQHRAAQAALATRPHPPVSAAIGGASAAVLAAMFPLDVAWIEAELDAEQAATPWPGAKHANVAAGEALGRSVAAEVMAWAAGDGIGLTDPGPAPAGGSAAGYWSAGMGPTARGALGARTFFLESGDEFRPGPPPAFGSAEFLAALAEVRQISDARTAEQIANAAYWHFQQSPRMNAVMFGRARDLIVKYHRNDAEAARILFVAAASEYDALAGCFEAKYHYWFLRPTMADPAITVPAGVGLPPHPSYPSAHSCISGAVTEVLALAFPPERAELEALAYEAGYSRVLGGIHYLFDSLAGLELGRNVAGKAWAADPNGIDITP